MTETKRLGPTINRGGSDQCVQTDPRFIAAVVERFGRLDFDLAATSSNAQAPLYFTPHDDSLAMDWSLLEGNLWLNCEFATAPVWAAKCMRSMGLDAQRLWTRGWVRAVAVAVNGPKQGTGPIRAPGGFPLRIPDRRGAGRF